MTQAGPDWDGFYRQDGPPPWSIGRPQPELDELIAQGKVRSEVLDAGCGHAELALTLAEQGYTAVGLDSSPAAIEAASATARERGFDSVSFAVVDLTDFDGYAGRFTTIMDSGLFHSLPVDKRQDYLRCIAHAATAEARLYILSFAAQVTGPNDQSGPRGVTEDEFRQVVSTYWVVDDIRPAWLHANASGLPEGAGPAQLRKFVDGDQLKMPGFLLSAHKKP